GKPGFQAPMLRHAALLGPFRITEHEDIRACQFAAMWATWRYVAQQAMLLIHLRLESISRPDIAAAILQTLKMMDRTMAFDELICLEASFLEMAVHIGGETHIALGRVFPPPLQDVVAGMRRSTSIQIQPMAVEAPGQLRAFAKGVWRSNGIEVDAAAPQRRVAAPETLVAAEIRQTRIHAHTGSRHDQ